jgi:hypothetical protein
MEVKVVSGSHISRRVNSDARKGGETSRIACASGVNTGRGFVFKTSLFVVGSLSGSCDQVLEDARNLFDALRRLHVVDALDKSVLFTVMMGFLTYLQTLRQIL